MSLQHAIDTAPLLEDERDGPPPSNAGIRRWMKYCRRNFSAAVKIKNPQKYLNRRGEA